jgi:hypothetical protein
MTKIPNSRPTYDLEERTFQFAKAVRLFIKGLPKSCHCFGHCNFKFGICLLFGIYYL